MRKALILLAVLLSAFAVSAAEGATPPAPGPQIPAVPRIEVLSARTSAGQIPAKSRDELLLEPVSSSVEFPEEEDGWKLKLGRQYLVGSQIAITPVSYETSKRLGCYAKGAKTLEGYQYFGLEKGLSFLILRADIQNLSPKAIDFTKLVSARVDCEEKTASFVFQADHSNGTDDDATLYAPKDVGRQNERFAINEADIFPIKPKETGHFIICLAVPDAVASDGGPHDLRICGKGFEAVFDTGSRAPSSAEAPGEGPFPDDAGGLPQTLSRIQYLKEAAKTLDTKHGGLDSIQFARNTYLESKIDQLLASQTAQLEKKIRLTTNGAALKASFSRLDRTAKMLRFNVFIDLGFARTKTFEIGVPFSYLVHLAPESAGCKAFLNSLPDRFAAGWKPLVFGVSGSLAINGDGSYSPLVEEMTVWDGNSGRTLGKVGNLRLADFLVTGHNPDYVKDLPSSLSYIRYTGNKYCAKNPYGLTMSLRQLSEKAAGESRQEYAQKFDKLEKEAETRMAEEERRQKEKAERMEKEADAKAEEMIRKTLAQKIPKPPEPKKPKVPPKPKPQVVVNEEERILKGAGNLKMGLDVAAMPFAYDLGTLERTRGGDGLPLRFAARIPAASLLFPMASVGWGETSNGVYVGWETCSSSKLFSALSLCWSLSGGVEIGSVVPGKTEDGGAAPPRPTLMTKTRCECALVARAGASGGLGVGASVIVDLTSAGARVGFGAKVVLMQGGRQ